MIKKYFTREVKIGLLVVVSGFILFFGFNFLKGINIFNPTNYYYATYSNIDGLVEAAPVFIKGHKIGQVKKISYDFSKDRSFVITLDIAKDLKLPLGTKAQLFDNGLVGGKAINLIYTPQSGVFHTVGDTLKSDEEQDMMTKLTTHFMPKIDHLLSSTDSLISSVRAITEGKKLKNSLSSMEKATANLEESSVALKGLMKKDVPKIVHNVDKMTEDFSVVGNNVRNIDFAKTTNTIDQTMLQLQNVAQKMNSNQGSLGLLINDRALYDNLTSTSQNANLLLIDIKQNPKNYVHFSVFGKKK
ncbi:MAG: MlaD family protein [Paludibacteraceae bacterium]|nr:MlaD family protein [Paludibacteraceae bacterium]